jgi:hypothetical protein
MKLLFPIMLLCLTACASPQSSQQAEEQSSGPTVYGQLSGSIDAISTR